MPPEAVQLRITTDENWLVPGPGATVPVQEYIIDKGMIVDRIVHAHDDDNAVITLRIHTKGNNKMTDIMFYPVLGRLRKADRLPSTGKVRVLRHPMTGHIAGIGWRVERSPYRYRLAKPLLIAT